MHPRILRLRHVLDRTGLSRSALYRLHASGSFPRRVQLAARSVGWLECDVDAWLSSRVTASKPAGTPPRPAPEPPAPLNVRQVFPERSGHRRRTRVQIEFPGL